MQSLSSRWQLLALHKQARESGARDEAVTTLAGSLCEAVSKVEEAADKIKQSLENSDAKVMLQAATNRLVQLP